MKKMKEKKKRRTFDNINHLKKSLCQQFVDYLGIY